MVEALHTRRCRTLLIGFAGHQGREYLPLLRRRMDIVGGIDPSPTAAALAEKEGFPLFSGLDRATRAVRFDAAVVTVPHSEHFAISRALLLAGKHVLKEKPFAVTEQQARELADLAEKTDRSIYTLVQRGFNPAFTFARDHLAKVGEPYWFSYDYHLNLPAPTSGWRAASDVALGGVLLDMGYHLLDILSGLFPIPPELRSTFLHRTAEMRERRLEDLASVQFIYPGIELGGSLRISRHSLERLERLTILGSHGALNVGPAEAALHAPDGTVSYRLVSEQPKNAAVDTMFGHYVDHLEDRAYRANHVARQLAAVQLLDRIYRERPIGPQFVRPAVSA